MELDTLFWVSFLILVSECRCYIWNYALSQALSEGAYEDQVYHPRNIHQNADEPLQAGAGDENHTKRDWTPCEGDSSCPRGRFCDRHYGTCERHRAEGDFCRRDDHCHRQHECVFGRCRVAIQLPDLGARCSSDDDCGEGKCCARQHGEYICKNRPQQGHMCFVPKGGLAYSLNELCPCEEGLVCINTAPHRNGTCFQAECDIDIHCIIIGIPACESEIFSCTLRKGFDRRSWKHLEQMRCTLP